MANTTTKMAVTVMRTKIDRPKIELAAVDAGANMLVGLVVTISKMRFQTLLLASRQRFPCGALRSWVENELENKRCLLRIPLTQLNTLASVCWAACRSLGRRPLSPADELASGAGRGHGARPTASKGAG